MAGRISHGTQSLALLIVFGVGGCGLLPASKPTPIEEAVEKLQAVAPFSDPAELEFLEDESAYGAHLLQVFRTRPVADWEAEGKAALESTARFANGRTKAEKFFLILDEVHVEFDHHVPRFMTILDGWGEAYPDSEPYRIALIYAHLKNAWNARGSGFADTVTEEGWRGFAKHRKKAEAAVEDALAQGINHPEFHAARLNVALGADWPRAVTEQAFLDGVAQDPLYFSLYARMAWYLMPRWYGDRGDATRFFHQARALARPQAGDAMGFMVAAYYTWAVGRDNMDFDVSFGELRTAYEDFAKVYPHALEYHNRMARIAIEEGAMDYAAEIFRTAATSFDADVWSLPAYDAWKAALLEGAPRPVQTPLHEAAREGDMKSLKTLIEEAESVDPLDDKGMTPLYYAVNKNQVEAAEALLEAGANPNAIFFGNHRGLLYHAIGRGHEEIATLLVDHGADYMAEYEYGQPLFFMLFYYDMENLIEKIVREYGEDVDMRDASGLTPLHYAAYFGDLGAIKRLIEAGADVNAQGDAGLTPLLRAVQEGHEETALYLLEQGAGVNAADADGVTPLMLAVNLDMEKPVRAMLERGADVMAKGKNGATALHVAAANGNNRLLELLLEQPGAVVDVATDAGRTPAHQAAEAGRTETLKLLVARGSNIKQPDEAGKTPQDLALEKGRARASDYLRSVSS